MDQNPPPSASATPVLFDEPISLLMQLWSASKAIPISVPYPPMAHLLSQTKCKLPMAARVLQIME